MKQKYIIVGTKIIGFVIVCFLAFSAAFGQYFRHFGYCYPTSGMNIDQKIWLIGAFLLSLLIIIIFCILLRCKIILPNLRLHWVNILYSNPLYLGIILFLLWGVILFLALPGLWNFDFTNQMYELLGSSHGRMHSDIYPIAHFLFSKNSPELTNQHGAFLTIIYDFFIYVSIKLFTSANPGIFFLSFSQLVLGVFALSYALKKLYTKCSPIIKLIILLVIGLNPYFPIYLIQLTKTPLFAINFLIFLTIFLQLRESEKYSKPKIILLFCTCFGMVIAVKFAFILLIPTIIVFSFLLNKNRKAFLFSTFSAISIFKILMVLISMSGLMKIDDPIEAKSIQIQQVALYVKTYPNDLNKKDSDDLSKIFSIQGLQDFYDPRITDVIKSTGGFHYVYLYRTVTKSDWKNFNRVWFTMLKKHPKLFIQAFFAKTFGYFDILDLPRRDVADSGQIPFILHKPKFYKYSISDYKKSQLKVIQEILDFYNTMPITSLLSRPNFWIVLTFIIISSKLIFTGDYKYFLSSVPFLLLMGVLIVSPVNNLDRYGISFFVLIPLIIPWFQENIAQKTPKT